jgi:hypothetical protein
MRDDRGRLDKTPGERNAGYFRVNTRKY